MGRAYLPEQWARNPAASMPVKALGAVLSSYANGESGDQDVWPSPETVAAALGISARHVQNLSAEGEGLKWWTRIHERTRAGGVMLTWRLHFPEISANRSPTEHERNHSSVGENHYALPNGTPTEAERKPNGSRTEAERNYSSDGRVEGLEGKKNNNTAPAVAEPVELDLQPQKPKDRTLTPTQEKAIAKRKTAEQAMREWNDIMAKVGNARIVKLDPAHVAVLSAAYALLGRPDKYPYTLTPFAGLLTWAAEDSPWYGKGQRNNGGERHVHTALSWCSRDHLARAVAAHEAWAASKELTPSVCLEVDHAA